MKLDKVQITWKEVEEREWGNSTIIKYYLYLGKYKACSYTINHYAKEDATRYKLECFLTGLKPDQGFRPTDESAKDRCEYILNFWLENAIVLEEESYVE